ncbi:MULTISPECIES: radical SAM protein [unclassified Carboxylicivirga]|uniref:radical SAM protein n=1 Tax=Carboxylicivirga TaxID=1628153 RepID=UPI003D34E28E
MSVFLFDEIVFGPVKSRRLGISLGVNLLPVNKKICSFDCIYCECGLNGQLGDKRGEMPTREAVKAALDKKLKAMGQEGVKPDVITFAGNGEPTLHPEFKAVIDDTIALRNAHCPAARIAVLSNASRLDRPDVVEALNKVDDNILKLDAGIETTIQQLDQPNYPFSLEKTLDQLCAFKGRLIIQTMFVLGEVDGQIIDNTGDADIQAWLSVLKRIQPRKVMIYTIERDTPHQGLRKVAIEQLKAIAARVEALGLEVSVSG